MNFYWSNNYRKDLRKGRTKTPVTFSSLIQHFQVTVSNTSPHMTTLFHARLSGRFKEIKGNLRRKKLHKVNHVSSFFGGSFSNRDKVTLPIQFRGERQSQHLKRWFFLKKRPIHFHINSTSVIRLVKQNKLSFSSI